MSAIECTSISGSTPDRDDTSWMGQGACSGKTNLFFPPRAERPQARVRREAQARIVCQACPVMGAVPGLGTRQPRVRLLGRRVRGGPPPRRVHRGRPHRHPGPHGQLTRPSLPAASTRRSSRLGNPDAAPAYGGGCGARRHRLRPGHRNRHGRRRAGSHSRRSGRGRRGHGRRHGGARRPGAAGPHPPRGPAQQLWNRGTSPPGTALRSTCPSSPAALRSPDASSGCSWSRTTRSSPQTTCRSPAIRVRTGPAGTATTTSTPTGCTGPTSGGCCR
jgi:hypothetical protein